MNIFFLAPRPVIDPFDKTLPHVKAVGSAIKDWFPVLGAVLFVSAIVILWIVFSSKTRRHRARREERRQRRLAFARNAAGLGLENVSKEKDRSGRRRRRHHRPRNPTLAETGGLPPVRDDDQPPQVQPH